MTVLTKPDIEQGLDNGSIVVEPKPNYIGPNSIDLTLHPELKVYRDGVLDARADNPAITIEIPDDGLVLQPGTLYIARTVERTFTPKHVPKIGGRSSTGRLGINIHQTAGFGDVGFNGTWTLEITVVQPVRVYPNMRIAQLWLFTISTELAANEQYQGRYQNQVAATTHLGHRDEFPGGGA